MKVPIFPNYIMRLWRRLFGRIYANHALKVELHRYLCVAHRAGLIDVIFDIGAHKGRWAREIHDLLPAARLFLFEANPLHSQELHATGFPFFLCALTNETVDTLDFYSLEDDEGSSGASVYKERTPHYQDVLPRRVSAGRLSDLATARNLPQPDLIKIDTQGSELDIIEGGRRIFSAAKYILIEMPLLEYNKGAPPMSEYLSTLHDLGFLPVALTEVHRIGPVVPQLDLLFAAAEIIDEQRIAWLEK